MPEKQHVHCYVFWNEFLPQPEKTEKTFLEKFIKMRKFARMVKGDSSLCRPPEQRDTGREEAPLCMAVLLLPSPPPSPASISLWSLTSPSLHLFFHIWAHVWLNAPLAWKTAHRQGWPWSQKQKVKVTAAELILHLEGESAVQSAKGLGGKP